MSILPKVVWSEGIFIAPQHFQQQEKYLESLMSEFITNHHPFYYGVSDLAFEQSLFKQGVVKLKKIFCIMRDGTILDLHGMDLDKVSLTVPSGIQESMLYVVINSKYNGFNEVSFEKNNTNARYVGYDKLVHDLIDNTQEPRQLTLAEPNVRLVLEKDLTDSHIALPIAVISLDNNGVIHMDDRYIPPSLNSQKNPILASIISEVYGLLLQKSKSLAQGLHDPNQRGEIELLDILMLQAINRYTAYLHHENQSTSSEHPECLFVELSKLCADLSTFSNSKRPEEFPLYNHDNLAECFSSLVFKLRLHLSTIREQRAVRINLERRDEATYVAQTPNQSILNNSNFILAVKADMPEEGLRAKLPTTMKIGAVENIRELIAYHLPGVKLESLAMAPRELPYHKGYIYFELDKESETWQTFNDTSGMAFHLAGDFPNVDLEFWAIKSLN